MTNRCNLRCTYCYVPQGGQTMTEAVGKACVDLGFRQPDSELMLSFFGGEPLMAFPLVKRIVEYAESRASEYGKRVFFKLSTNAVLLTDEHARFFRRHRFLLNISLDGIAQVHDHARPLPDGTGTSSALFEKVGMVLEAVPLTLFSAVITPESAAYVVDGVAYMWGQGIRIIGHELEFLTSRWAGEDFEVLRRSYEELSHWYREKIACDEYFYLGIFDDRLGRHPLSPPRAAHGCEFGKRTVHVTPDGSIYPCGQFAVNRDEGGGYEVGTCTTGFDRDKLQTLASKASGGRHPCDDIACEYRDRCSNYCVCLNWRLTGELDRVPEVVCRHERILVPIVEILAQKLWTHPTRAFAEKHGPPLAGVRAVNNNRGAILGSYWTTDSPCSGGCADESVPGRSL